MRPVSKKQRLSFALSALLLASAIQAAPTITSWSHDIESNQERLTLRWDEQAEHQTNLFAEAGEIVVIIPGGQQGHGLVTRSSMPDSLILERTRIQNVTLPSGQPGLQLRLQLSQWVQPEITASDDALTLAFPVDRSRTQVIAGDAGFVFTDEEIASLDNSSYFGSASAPETGAGQVTDISQNEEEDGAPLSEYWVPPSVRREPGQAGNRPDLYDVGLEAKLNQIVNRVDFQGTDLENVLRLIAEEAELNLLIKPSDVANRQVTLRLRRVTLREMLDAILKVNELGYTIEEGAIVRIVPRDQVKSTLRETVTQSIPINWVDAQQLTNALQPFIDPEDGALTFSEANNLLIIRDVPETVSQILDLVNQIDQADRQVLIESRLVNMTENAFREFGTRTSFRDTGTAARPVIDENGFISTNDITQSGTSSSSSSSSFTNALTGGLTGTTGNTSNNTSTNTFNSQSSAGIAPETIGQAGLLGTTAEAFQFTNRSTLSIFREDFDIDLELNMQESRGEAVTLSNPTVLTLNNFEASVNIKRQIPYVSGVNSEQGSFATIQFVDVGTEVTITPRITNHGWVAMTISPEQIIDTGQRPQGVPVTDERSIDASVIVRDEQTVALGGLRSFEAQSSEDGVPFLLRVPVFSWLFKRQLNTQTKTELYLFVTPHIVKDPTPTAYQMAIYDKIDYNWDLPDYYFDEITTRSAPAERNDPFYKEIEAE